MTKFFVKTTIEPDEERFATAQEAFKNYNEREKDLDSDNWVEGVDEMIFDTKKSKKQVMISYSEGYFRNFSMELYSEDGSKIGELNGHFEDISSFANEDLIDIGDATSQVTYDCNEALTEFLEKHSEDTEGTGYDYDLSPVGIWTETNDKTFSIPMLFKPLFITYMDIKDKDVAKTLLDNLPGIIFKESYFLPQMICLLKKHLDEKDEEILTYCGFENNLRKHSTVFYKLCGLISDETNVF